MSEERGDSTIEPTASCAWSENLRALAILLLIVGITALALRDSRAQRDLAPVGRVEVTFWHFWGGKERPAVEQVVDRFNASQDKYFVRAVSMPGNNLDLKFFLGVAGGDPPDLVNQDDPIVADWAARGALLPLDELASPAEYAELQQWLFPAAKTIGSYRGRLFALCNGLDIRALYCDLDVLQEFGLQPPRTLEELDHLAQKIAPPAEASSHKRFGFLPDPRRIWAWGIVFGGRFFDPATGQVTANSPPIVRAAEWMASYSRLYGAENVARFRKGDQALPGAAFPLLEGRYAVVMDGQWRVAEILAAERAARARGESPRRFAVIPLPPPTDGTQNAGWVNGNFFVVPRGAKHPQGAWEFMKFWSGFGGHEADAAEACVAGGWIPASQHVVEHPRFQQYLADSPLFAEFVRLAGSPNQIPPPAVPGAQFFQDEIMRAAEDIMYKLSDPTETLQAASQRIQSRLQAAQDDAPPNSPE